jgi:NAD-dependent SIR2 family protein deacetylase
VGREINREPDGFVCQICGNAVYYISKDDPKRKVPVCDRCADEIRLKIRENDK